MSNFKQSRVWTTAVGGAMAVAMVFGASQAMAVAATETANYTVSVVVDNAFTMTETTPVSFGTPGVVTITGAPPFTAMTITVLTAVTLQNPATVGEATFTADLDATGLGYSLTTDAAGELVIQIGGTLTTEVAGMDENGIAKVYTDGTYIGTYSLTVSY